MLILTGRLERRLLFLPGPLATGVAVSLAATIGTAPVSLMTFGQVSVSGIAANLLVVPLLAPLMALGVASIAAGFFWQLAASKLNLLSSILLSWIVEVAGLFGRFPLLQFEHLLPAAVLVAAGVLSWPLAAALLGAPLPYGSSSPFVSGACRRLRRLAPHTRRRRRVAAAALVTAFLVSALALEATAAIVAERAGAAVARSNWPDSHELRVLDVGEGSAALLRTAGGKAVLIDGGPEGAGLGNQLSDLGAQRLELVVLSHPHADHFAGLLEAIEGVKVESYVDWVDIDGGAPFEESVNTGRPPLAAPTDSSRRAENGVGETREAESYRQLLHLLERQGSRRLSVENGGRVVLEDLSLEFYGPRRRTVLPGGADLNDESLVVVIRSEAAAILLPGDAEAAVLGTYQLPPVGAMVVPHHGSDGSVTAGLLRRLAPRAAIISVGRGNSFGHPHPDVVEGLEKAGLALFRTDQHGWIALRIGPWGIAVEPGRKAPR
jgi:competence protein ComEC